MTGAPSRIPPGVSHTMVSNHEATGGCLTSMAFPSHMCGCSLTRRQHGGRSKSSWSLQRVKVTKISTGCDTVKDRKRLEGSDDSSTCGSWSIKRLVAGKAGETPAKATVWLFLVSQMFYHYKSRPPQRNRMGVRKNTAVVLGQS